MDETSRQRDPAPALSAPGPAALQQAYGRLSGAELMEPFITRVFPGRIALVSSFGSEAALLLALAAEIDRGLPVIFLDTGKLFGETLRYRDQLAARLGLTDVRSVQPDAAALAERDPRGMLWHADPDACCGLRKVEPLERALAGFAAWISGRKRYQSAGREALPTLELAEGRVKLNPLAPWPRERVEAEFARRALPRHPLEADGFLSIGCMPCTDRVAPGQDLLAGRWRGLDKSECGIHVPAGPVGDG